MKHQRTYTILICTLLALLTPYNVHAQNSTKPPLEITADGSLEWFKKEQKLIARGNATASQDNASISAGTLSANYRDGAQGRFEISQITAEKDVVVRAQRTRG